MQIDNFYVDTINNINEKDILNSTILYCDQIIGKIIKLELVEEYISGNLWSVIIDVTTKNKKLLQQFIEDKEINGYNYKF